MRMCPHDSTPFGWKKGFASLRISSTTLPGKHVLCASLLRQDPSKHRLKRADFNLILQLLKRTLERYERTGETSAGLCNRSLKFRWNLSRNRARRSLLGYRRNPIDATGSEWVHADPLGGAAGKSSARNLRNVSGQGLNTTTDERGRVFIKYAPPRKAEDPYDRLTDQDTHKVSQTKIAEGTRTAKFLWIDSPYDLRTLDHGSCSGQP